MKKALVLYPNQLFPLDKLPAADVVVMVEDPLFFGTDQEFPAKLHKQKLILHWASMRRYAEEVLWPAKIEVEYIKMDVLMQAQDLLHGLKKYDKVVMFDPVHDDLLRRLLAARRAIGDELRLEFLPNPNFYLQDVELRKHFVDKRTTPFVDFYQWQRERFNVLIGADYKPLGGKWILAPDAAPTDTIMPPNFQVFGANKWVGEAAKRVEKEYAANPGSIDFIWPTSHAEATAWLDNFVNNRLDNFATYQGTIHDSSPWLYHSVLSSSLNIGLLSPQQVVAAALKRHAAKPVPLPSLEAFVRQILGWREYMRGAYLVRGEFMQETNLFRHTRQLTASWYAGNTGLPPLDKMIERLQQHAYAPHAERLQVAGNLMLLCEIDPREAYTWFQTMFIDSYDWALVPNVYSLSQFADGGSLGVGLPLIDSEQLLAISRHAKADWVDIWDGLLWRFVEKNELLLAKNPSTTALVDQLAGLNADRRRIIRYRAEDFLNRHTR